MVTYAMDILETLRRSGVVAAIARHEALAPSDAGVAVRALLPGLLAGLRGRYEQQGQEAARPGPLEDLLNALGGPDMVLHILQPDRPDIRRGETLLMPLCGSLETSRQLAAHAARNSPVNAEQAYRILAMLAMAVGGYVAARLRSARALSHGVPDFAELLGGAEN